jgi:hypothetical protein
VSRRKQSGRYPARTLVIGPLAHHEEPALEGSLAEVQLSTVLAIFEMERRSGVIALGTRAHTGHVMVRSGQAVCASVFGAAGLRGREALFAMLGWRSGRFVFRPALVEAADEMGASTTGLLLEAAQRTDEGDAHTPHAPHAPM